MPNLNKSLILILLSGMPLGAATCMFVFRTFDIKIGIGLFCGLMIVLFLIIAIAGLYFLGKHRKEVLDEIDLKSIDEIGNEKKL